jgi:hypothetical protein
MAAIIVDVWDLWVGGEEVSGEEVFEGDADVEVEEVDEGSGGDDIDKEVGFVVSVPCFWVCACSVWGAWLILLVEIPELPVVLPSTAEEVGILDIEGLLPPLFPLTVAIEGVLAIELVVKTPKKLEVCWNAALIDSTTLLDVPPAPSPSPSPAFWGSTCAFVVAAGAASPAVIVHG